MPRLMDCSIADVPALLALSRHVGWPHTADDWSDLLGVATVFGHREADGTLSSSTALVRFGPQLASVGLVIVHDRRRGAGLGRELMQRCLDSCNCECLSLIATPMGRPVYDRLGFLQVGAVAKFIGEPSREGLQAAVGRGAGAAATPVRLLTADRTSLADIVALDAEANGTLREGMLARMLMRSEHALLARDGAGRLTGYVFVMQKLGLSQLAPLVARDDDTAIALIAAAAQLTPGMLRIDVPLQQASVLDALRDAQWPRASDDPVMTLQGKPLPGQRLLVRAISFQAWG